MEYCWTKNLCHTKKLVLFTSESAYTYDESEIPVSKELSIYGIFITRHI
jgi:hypothetical protein